MLSKKNEKDSCASKKVKKHILGFSVKRKSWKLKNIDLVSKISTREVQRWKRFVIWRPSSRDKWFWKSKFMKKWENFPGFDKWHTCSAPFVNTREGWSDLCKGYPLVSDFARHAHSYFGTSLWSYTSDRGLGYLAWRLLPEGRWDRMRGERLCAARYDS